MICIDISGGFGNQLFQYATAYALAKSRGEKLFIDASHFDVDYQKKAKVTIRDFYLDKLNIECAGYLKTKTAVTENKLFRLLNRYKKYNEMGDIFGFRFIKDADNYKYIPKQFENAHNLYLNGYFQSWKYFDQYFADLINMLTPKNGVLSDLCIETMKQCRHSHSVGIHIRRGDYKKCNDWLIDESYYIKAFEKMMNIDAKKKQIYVFCDEPGFAEKLFKEIDNITYITAKGIYTDIEEFFILSSCNNHIISNSSFSWWAAYLARNDEQIVVAPVYSHWKEEYYLPKWQKIPAKPAKDN